MFDKFHNMLPKNTFYVLLVKILHFENKTRNIYAHMLQFTFQKEDVIDQSWGGGARDGKCNKKG